MLRAISTYAVLLLLLKHATCAPCVKQLPESFTVQTTAQAAQLAAAVDCEGGTFSVLWLGDVIVNKTIAVGTGTSLTITAAPAAPAAATRDTVNGYNTTQLFKVAAGSLVLEGLTLSAPFNVLGAAAIYASELSTVSLTNCEVSDSQGALGAIAIERNCTLSLARCKILRNAAIPRLGKSS
jgi:hypothetical protein